jgi:hypothetical protein
MERRHNNVAAAAKAVMTGTAITRVEGSLWASKRERLIGEIIGRVGGPDQHLDDIAFERAIRTGPNAQLRASLLQRNASNTSTTALSAASRTRAAKCWRLSASKQTAKQ